MNLATQSLKATSIEAAQLWREFERAKNPAEVEQILQSVWQNQEQQELAVDAHAELVDQIEAEIAAVKARMNHLVNIHEATIRKLQGWREQLDKTIIYFNESGIIHPEVAGKHRRIAVKENPPTCEILVKPEELPEQYRTEKTQITVTPNKRAITAAWKQGIPVDGTRVYCKRKVVYEMLPGSNLQAFSSAERPSEQPNPTKAKRRKKRT
ncbi:MAG: hypothetical protein F6K36_25980 [Symploca sp. SIO3C6]|uniref:Siphovirus Gp157 family protein n=1 Tax=Symploca sp. SIO1C4 TaxID=2607765 RepID=A0A6B3NM56_9CYAN|nr:hypothetical protein [Symploca sp. SIO3C6]NER30651.1 hypothetical protein [Symploca sp. SIO1C4]